MSQTRLSNGLEVCVLTCRRAPIVSTALFYRAGASRDRLETSGTAHFLEHMMFRGSPLFGDGEIDEKTQSMGGSNNAFTSHDCAVYQFSFSGDRWELALDVEADRMRELTLDPALVEAERAVILEEISQHDDDPWDSLEQEIFQGLYDGHPYSRPILGTRETIERLSVDHLREFHERYYRPDNAVLVVAGDVGREAFDRVEQILGGSARDPGLPVGGEARPTARTASRVRRSKGETPRLLMAMQGPAATDEDYASLRLAAAVLGLGRTSRLYRTLVDEDQSLASVNVDVTETLLGGALLLSAEALPGVSRDRIEESILDQFDQLSRKTPNREELARAKRLMKSDWVLSHQHTHQMASATAVALGLFGGGFLTDHLQALEAVSTTAVQRAAARYLRLLEVGVIGWSHSGFPE